MWSLIPLVAYAAIVPCGFGSDVNTFSGSISCDLCDVGQLIQNIINFMVGISIPIAVVLFGWSGILMFTSGASEPQRTKGKKIFNSVFVGFVIVISGWLVVQTILSVLVDDKFFIGGNWNQLQCQNEVERQNQSDIKVTDWLKDIIGIPPEGSAVSGSGGASGSNVTYSCANKFVQQGNMCIGPDGKAVPATATYTPTYRVNYKPRDNCSIVVTNADWGSNAAAAACIAQNESSCGAANMRSADNARDNRQVSVGLYQINLTVHKMTCNGVTLDCPKAFSGKYTGSSKNVSIVDENLYQQCRNAALNNSCNTTKARELFTQAGDWDDWYISAGKCGLAR